MRSPEKALEQVLGFHGPRRYAPGVNEFNGARTLIQLSDAFEKECAKGVGSNGTADIKGPGAVYDWFVGSARAFLFGFTRLERYASRRVATVLSSEFEAVTGRKAS